MKTRISVFILALFLSNYTIAQTSNSDLIQKVDAKLDEYFKASNTPGVSVSIILPDGSETTLVKGYADEEKKIEMGTRTKMLGGSTGKVFYSVVLMQLIEEGKIDLDSPIADHMDDDWFSRLPNAERLTVRNLMRHQSGIPRYVFAEQFQKDVHENADRVWKPEELLAYIFDNDPLFEVGTSFAYSDTNYIILAMLIEKVTGNTLYEEVDRRVLKRAGLNDVVPQNTRSYDNLAQGYNADNDPFFPGKALNEEGKSTYNWQFEWAGGGLVITTRDLAVLGKKIYEGEMFDSGLLEDYFNGVDAGQLGGTWGLGVHMQTRPAGKVYGHSGFMPGYITNMLYYPEDGFSICFQINTSDRARASLWRNLPSLGDMVSYELNKGD